MASIGERSYYKMLEYDHDRWELHRDPISLNHIYYMLIACEKGYYLECTDFQMYLDDKWHYIGLWIQEYGDTHGIIYMLVDTISEHPEYTYFMWALNEIYLWIGYKNNVHGLYKNTNPLISKI